MSFRSLCIALIAAVATLTGMDLAAAQPVGNPAPAGPAIAAPEPASSAYILGRDDVVEVGLLGRTDFGGRARVQADGTVQLPMIGKVPAADKTTSEFSDTVRKALQTGGFFSDPVVTVEVVGYASRYVTVLGAIGSPGLVPINRPYRMSEILARVGGVRDNAADYLIVRPEKGEERRILIRDLATGDLSQDPYVQPGDKIFAPLADVYYIYGQVNSPGSYTLQSGMTVRMAVAKAGGLTASGSDKKVDNTRDGKKVKVDLAAPVKAGDILVVGERMF